MQNRWNTKTTEATEETKTSSSKKMGIAMGVVGALLVAAGAAPMIFPSDNLQGDLTTQESEAPDPLVALLSGGDMGSKATSTPVVTKTVVNDNDIIDEDLETEVMNMDDDETVAAVTTPKPVATVASTPAPTKAAVAVKATTAPKTEIDKILNEEGASDIAENKNVGKNDTAGSVFGEVETMHAAAGLSNTASNSATTKTTTQPKPKTTVQTGLNTSLILGLLFLFMSGSMAAFSSLARRK